jgi:hypothetical protein
LQAGRHCTTCGGASRVEVVNEMLRGYSADDLGNTVAEGIWHSDQYAAENKDCPNQLQNRVDR